MLLVAVLATSLSSPEPPACAGKDWPRCRAAVIKAMLSVQVRAGVEPPAPPVGSGALSQVDHSSGKQFQKLRFARVCSPDHSCTARK